MAGFSEKIPVSRKIPETWYFRGFFGFFLETTLTILIKLGQNVVLMVPDHLQKTAHQNLFSFSRYSSSKSAFFGIFGARKKCFSRKKMFFIFGIYILQFVKISEKNFWHEKFPTVRSARSDTSNSKSYNPGSGLWSRLHYWVQRIWLLISLTYTSVMNNYLGASSESGQQVCERGIFKIGFLQENTWISSNMHLTEFFIKNKRIPV